MRLEFLDIYRDVWRGWRMMKTKHGFQYTNGTHAFTLDWLNPSVVYLLTTYYLDPQQRDGF